MNAILNKIIVKEPAVKENVTETGIVLQQKPNRGEAFTYEVISTGADVKVVKPGITILAGEYAGTKFKYEGADYRILSEDEVIATL